MRGEKVPLQRMELAWVGDIGDDGRTAANGLPDASFYCWIENAGSYFTITWAIPASFMMS